MSLYKYLSLIYIWKNIIYIVYIYIWKNTVHIWDRETLNVISKYLKTTTNLLLKVDNQHKTA